jgi:four helix bundle protein
MERPAAKKFEDLLMWRKAHQFVLAVYGLVSQMRRAAVSIPANIAEGFRKRGRAAKARFMNIAEGSIEESRYYLILARDLSYGATEQLVCDLDEVGRLVHAYARTILSPVS